jgi:hypothetical protein
MHKYEPQMLAFVTACLLQQLVLQLKVPHHARLIGLLTLSNSIAQIFTPENYLQERTEAKLKETKLSHRQVSIHLNR